MPVGLLSFQSEVEEVGASEKFSLYVDASIEVNGYWKQNQAGDWVNLASEEYGGGVVQVGGKIRLDFLLVDGGEFDDDGIADGIITDPGAPALFEAAEPEPAPAPFTPENPALGSFGWMWDVI